MPRISLPIDEVLPNIIESLSAAGALVLVAQPGAGKTTRVPPALLDAGLAQVSNNQPGQILVLQPRRIAARAAAVRMSEERASELGQEIGYEVRFEKRSSRNTRILVCTEGVCIRRLQSDPLLGDVSIVIFDEFHERSLNSDLALAMAKQVRESVRPDLKIVVMSATLNADLVSQFLNDCPVIECEGRNYPVNIEHLNFPASGSIEQQCADGVRKMVPRTTGHLLTFLPGVGEIRQTQTLVETAIDEDVDILPLYGDLPLNEQQKILQPSKRRKIILATNVAETSLTIDGVTGVIDSGYARVNRFDPQLSLNRLALTRISKASAAQRAGRAGRNAPGVCLRLWTEREQQMLADFETPEVLRVELSECVLQLMAWGESDVYKFPWYERPSDSVLKQALELLDLLDAVSDGKITDLGKRMSMLPLQPRLARLLIEGHGFGQTSRAALCAALLSERDPFRREESRRVAEHHSDSDLLDRADAIQTLQQSGFRNSNVGQILDGPAKQVIRVAQQLERLTLTTESRDNSRDIAAVNPDDSMLRSILAAFPDRVCKLREPKSRRAVMVGGKGVRLSDESAVAQEELFVAVELIELSQQSELLVRQASRVERAWLPESHINSSTDVFFDAKREKVIAMKRERFCDLLIDEAVIQMQSNIDPGELLAKAVASNYDVSTLVDDESRQYAARLECLRKWLPELQLPVLDENVWRQLLPEWCTGLSSVADLRARSLVQVLQSKLTPQQLAEIAREAPERIVVPSGRSIKLDYRPGSSPVLAVRIQELFGMTDTPRVARNRVPVLLHLLAPNYHIQQISTDLSSFWKNTYPEVKKELKRRYPKHSWPDDPLKAEPESRPRRKS